MSVRLRSKDMCRIQPDRVAWVYIVANRRRGVLYVGATTDLKQRVWQHKLSRGSRFTACHSLSILVYAEEHPDISTALARERSLKRWQRDWKFRMIETENPDWLDLYETLNL